MVAKRKARKSTKCKVVNVKGKGKRCKCGSKFAKNSRCGI